MNLKLRFKIDEKVLIDIPGEKRFHISAQENLQFSDRLIGTQRDDDKPKGLWYASQLKRVAGIAKLQYHATSWDRVPSILKSGLKLPIGHEVATFVHGVPSISTADSPHDAKVYAPHGALLELTVRPGHKYLVRSPRQMKKGETLVQAVDRWAGEAKEKGASGFWMDGWQSTVGNQTYEPSALQLLRIVNIDEAPNSVKLLYEKWLEHTK